MNRLTFNSEAICADSGVFDLGIAGVGWFCWDVAVFGRGMIGCALGLCWGWSLRKSCYKAGGWLIFWVDVSKN